jgi:hypothetical protein
MLHALDVIKNSIYYHHFYGNVVNKSWNISDASWFRLFIRPSLHRQFKANIYLINVSAIVPSLRHIFFVESGVKHHKPDLAENIY